MREHGNLLHCFLYSKTRALQTRAPGAGTIMGASRVVELQVEVGGALHHTHSSAPTLHHFHGDI